MEIKETEGKKLEKNFQVHIPIATLEEKVDLLATEQAKTAKMDGFRDGKVPVDVIKSKLKESLTKTALDETVNEVSRKIVIEHKLKIATKPSATITNFDENKGVEYTVRFELYPEVPALDPSKYTVTQYLCEVSDKDVDKVVEDLRKARRKPTKEDDKVKAALGHLLTIDFVGYLDGKEFDGGKAENARLELGAKQFIEGFEDGLVGCKAGDKKKLKLKFPAVYHAKDLAGKDVEFDVTVKEIATLELPELNEEFAAMFSAKDLQDLKSQLKEELTKRYNKVAFSLTKKEILDILDKEINFDLPEAMVNNELNGLMKQLGLEAKAEEVTDKDKKKYEKIAERRVKLGFVLTEVAQANKLEITQPDLQNAIIDYARTMPGKETQVIEYFTKNPGAVDVLKGPIIEDKAVEFIVSMAKAKDKKVTIEALIDLVKKAEEESTIV